MIFGVHRPVSVFQSHDINAISVGDLFARSFVKLDWRLGLKNSSSYDLRRRTLARPFSRMLRPSQFHDLFIMRDHVRGEMALAT